VKVWIRACFFILLSGFPFIAIQAVESLTFHVEQADFSGLHLRQVAIEVGFSDQGPPRIFLSIAKLKTDQGEAFRDLKIVCSLPDLQEVIRFDQLQCPSGDFSVHHPVLGRLKGKVDFSYYAADEKIQLSIRKLYFGGGVVTLELDSRQGQWKANLKGRGLQAVKLKKLMALAGSVSFLDQVSDLSGRVRIDLSVNGTGSTLTSFRINLRTFDLAFDGNSVAEELDAVLDLSLHKHGEAWQIREQVSLLDGAIYFEPGIQLGEIAPGFLLEPGEKPIVLSSDALWSGKQIQLQKLIYDHPGLFKARVHGLINAGDETAIGELVFSLDTRVLEKMFPVYLQPLLFGTGLDEMEIVGRTRLDLKLDEAGITDFHLIMGDVFAEDPAGRFHVAGLDGDIRLNSDPVFKDSAMRWQGGAIYKVDIGASEMKLSSKGRSMKLREVMRVPMFDGVLEVKELVMENLGLDDYSVYLKSNLTPITLSEFTEAMGWPLMAGTISGEIPGAKYQHGDLMIEGTLHVRVFDGDILIRNLKIKDLFGLVPTLYADIVVNNIDLGILTQTFEFGDITGRLSGYVHGLKLENWEPVQFDAWLTTPEDDRSRHRISQRAIENLTSIGGGGASNAISRGLLGMFEDFPYSRIGLGCRLIESTCHMRGVESAPDGFYIVKHAWLPPWLDIKGYNWEVNWKELMERLKNLSKTESPVIE